MESIRLFSKISDKQSSHLDQKIHVFIKNDHCSSVSELNDISVQDEQNSAMEGIREVWGYLRD